VASTAKLNFDAPKLKKVMRFKKVVIDLFVVSLRPCVCA
jgi:hypothetical protein